MLTLRQNDLITRNLLIRDLTQQMRDTVESRPLLVIAFDNPPAGFGNGIGREHALIGGAGERVAGFGNSR